MLLELSWGNTIRVPFMDVLYITICFVVYRGRFG